MDQNIKKNAMTRLTKERDRYIKEIEEYNDKLGQLGEDGDKYAIRLLSNQLSETKAALQAVENQLSKYSCEVCEH